MRKSLSIYDKLTANIKLRNGKWNEMHRIKIKFEAQEKRTRTEKKKKRKKKERI